jgi:hypothetical protein
MTEPVYGRPSQLVLVVIAGAAGFLRGAPFGGHVE